LWPAAEASPFGVGLAVLELPAEPESLEQVRLSSELVVRDEYDPVESRIQSAPFSQFGPHGRIHPCVHPPPADPVTAGSVDVRPLRPARPHPSLRPSPAGEPSDSRPRPCPTPPPRLRLWG